MDKYQRVRVIGKGSFGRAILVRSKKTSKQYIIKEINVAQLSRKEKTESSNEIRVLAQLNHPYIVRYRESFMHNSVLCIVMDYAEKGDMYAAIQRRKGRYFQEEQIWTWFVQLCLALKHVHDRKILHRDLKTQNIFINQDKSLALGDFGIARVLSNTMECAQTAIGTPYYLSPEICEDRPYNHKSDIWSLGCVLYEIVTHRHAFDAQNMRGLVMKILRGRYPSIPSHFSTELRDMIDLMLKKDPKQRPSINQILRMAPMRTRVQSMLSQTMRKAEFSHTIIHGGPGIAMDQALPKGMTLLDPRNRMRRRRAVADQSDARAAEAPPVRPLPDRRVPKPSDRAARHEPSRPPRRHEVKPSVAAIGAAPRGLRDAVHAQAKKQSIMDRVAQERARRRKEEEERRARLEKARHDREQLVHDQRRDRKAQLELAAKDQRLALLKQRQKELLDEHRRIQADKLEAERRRQFEENRRAAQRNRLRALEDRGVIVADRPAEGHPVPPDPTTKAHQQAKEILARVQKEREAEAERQRQAEERRRIELEEIARKRAEDVKREREARLAEARAKAEADRLEKQRQQQIREQQQRALDLQRREKERLRKKEEEERLAKIAAERAAEAAQKAEAEARAKAQARAEAEAEAARLAKAHAEALAKADAEREAALREAQRRAEIEARAAAQAEMEATRIKDAAVMAATTARAHLTPVVDTDDVAPQKLPQDGVLEEGDDDTDSSSSDAELSEEQADRMATIILDLEDVVDKAEALEACGLEAVEEMPDEEDGPTDPPLTKMLIDDQKNEMAQTGLFVFDGQGIQLAGVSDDDSLSFRIESLRVHLEEEIGFDAFMAAYSLLNDLYNKDDEEERINLELKSLLDDQVHYVNLIAQLMYCEDRVNSQQ